MTGAQVSGGPEKLLAYQFPARADHLCVMREKLRETLEAIGLTETTRNCMVLAVGEACMNIMQHAYCEEAGDIIVEVERKGESLLFRITDFAHRKTREEELKSRPLNELRPGGLGCHIINEIMDEVKLVECGHPCGNVLQMKKCIEEQQDK